MAENEITMPLVEVFNERHPHPELTIYTSALHWGSQNLVVVNVTVSLSAYDDYMTFPSAHVAYTTAEAQRMRQRITELQHTKAAATE